MNWAHWLLLFLFLLFVIHILFSCDKRYLFQPLVCLEMLCWHWNNLSVLKCTFFLLWTRNYEFICIRKAETRTMRNFAYISFALELKQINDNKLRAMMRNMFGIWLKPFFSPPKYSIVRWLHRNILKLLQSEALHWILSGRGSESLSISVSVERLTILAVIDNSFERNDVSNDSFVHSIPLYIAICALLFEWWNWMWSNQWYELCNWASSVLHSAYESTHSTRCYIQTKFELPWKAWDNFRQLYPRCIATGYIRALSKCKNDVRVEYSFKKHDKGNVSKCRRAC